MFTVKKTVYINDDCKLYYMKTKKIISAILIIYTVIFSACNIQKISIEGEKKDNYNHVVQTAQLQLTQQVKIIKDSGKLLFPWTAYNGQIIYTPETGWTSGFFPGTLIYMYELSGDKKWLDYGVEFSEALDTIKYLTRHHDIGFIINSSFGNVLEHIDNNVYKGVIIQAAKSLSTRYRDVPGIIQSWNANKQWRCPVIIDNMMNLELMFKATVFSGDSSFHKMAVSHADVTLKNHFRKDGSCYHVIDYDIKNGNVLNKHTAQGYAHESAWARGQAWALYGYTICYRFTKDKRYLDQADKIYQFIFTHKNLPTDLIPYWDFDAPQIPNEPRDASSAAIIASALYELTTFGKRDYKKTADKIMLSLSSPAYLAIVGTNGNFLLKHSVGSIPHGREIDTPLNYADYYFLEALIRKVNLEK